MTFITAIVTEVIRITEIVIRATKFVIRANQVISTTTYIHKLYVITAIFLYHLL